MSKNSKYRLMPIIMAACVVLGILIGSFNANHFSGKRLSIINTSSNKLNNLLRIIDEKYVDKVDADSLVEKAMPQLLSELDPHSAYVSAKEAQAIGDQLNSSFTGVGIEFVIRQDTIRVQNVIKNGPAERAGLLAGDKIVSVDGKPFVGKIVTDQEAMRRLKGPRDTKVTIGVLRYKEKKERSFVVTRGDIVTHTINAAYMLDDETGYIKINKFGENSYAELLIALAKLQSEGFNRLIIDLRSNTGGYLEAAVKMANEFLPKNKLIVYTQGRKSPRQDYRSNGKGSYQNIPLVVLIDEISASASEIFAAAMQDNDRATIIGRRSFGKGLVQEQIPFSDGSMIRLTIARYYSPSGRCIQKPYSLGDEEGYMKDMIDRLEHGELYSRDSIHHAGPAYHTKKGRTVYGGGGITPDIFIPEDTSLYTSYYKEAVMSGLIMQFAYNFTDEYRQQMKAYDSMAALSAWLSKQNIVEKFAAWAAASGLKRRNLMIRKSHPLLERYLKSRIIYNMLDEEAFDEYLNLDDPVIKTAIDTLENK